MPLSLLLGQALGSGPSSLLLSSHPSLHCTDYPVSMETSPGWLCQEAKATTAGGGWGVGVAGDRTESKEQEVSTSYSQMVRETYWKPGI